MTAVGSSPPAPAQARTALKAQAARENHLRNSSGWAVSARLAGSAAEADPPIWDATVEIVLQSVAPGAGP